MKKKIKEKNHTIYNIFEFIMATLSGKEFNDKYPDIEFYKVLTNNGIHFGFQYQHGLNIDTLPFNPRGECSKGGLYFVSIHKLYMWLNLGIYIARVTIPDNASIYTENNTFKADKLTFGFYKDPDAVFRGPEF